MKGYKRKKGPLNRCICCWRDISTQGKIFLLPKAFPTLRFLFYDYHWQLSYPLWKFLCPGKAIGCCRGFPQSGPAPRIPPWVTMPGPSRNQTIFMRRRYKETLPTVNNIGKKSWCLVQEEGTFSKWSPRHSRPTALISHEVARAMVHRSTWRRTLKTTQKNVKQLYIARKTDMLVSLTTCKRQIILHRPMRSFIILWSGRDKHFSINLYIVPWDQSFASEAASPGS